MNWRTTIFQALVLLILAGVITATRLYTFAEPLEHDLTTYAVFGHEMLQGRALYSDLWNNYTPAIFLTYAASECVVGYGPRQVFVLGVLAALVTMLGVRSAASSLNGRSAGLWAATFWAICSSDLRLEANQPNTEVFINACVAWSFALFVRLDPRGGDSIRTLMIGLLAALATAYKPVVVFIPASLGLAHFLSAPFESEVRRARALRQVLIIGALGAAFWAGVFGWFAVIGRLQDFLEAVVFYNRHYSGRFLTNLIYSVQPRMAWPKILRFAAPLYALSALAIAWGLQIERRPGARIIAYPLSRHRCLLLAYFVGVQLSVAATGHFHPHYYQLWLPALAIGAGWAVDLLWKADTRAVRIICRLAGPVALAIPLAHELPNFRQSPENWSRKKYGEIFVDSERLGRRIDGILTREEQFYQCGDEVGLYFSSRRRPPVNPVWWGHLFDHPYAAKLRTQVLEQLQRSRPELIVVCPRFSERPSKDNPIMTWILSTYKHADDISGAKGYEIYVRRGGTLISRLTAKPYENQAK